jgi:hypothetical protein
MALRITGTLRFPDLDRHWIEVDCPRCRLATPVTLRDVRSCGVVICRGCKADIRLSDHLGEYHRIRRRLERTLGAALSSLARG